MAFADVRSEQGSMAEINITPLVDVMLVLLVIFMVTAPLLDHRMDLTLPQRTPPPPEPPAIVSLEVAPGDMFRFAGQTVAPAQLQAMLENQLREIPASYSRSPCTPTPTTSPPPPPWPPRTAPAWTTSAWTEARQRLEAMIDR